MRSARLRTLPFPLNSGENHMVITPISCLKGRGKKPDGRWEEEQLPGSGRRACCWRSFGTGRELMKARFNKYCYKLCFLETFSCPLRDASRE